MTDNEWPADLVGLPPRREWAALWKRTARRYRDYAYAFQADHKRLAREKVALREELQAVRIALKGYSDSDLVSLAQATMCRMEALAAAAQAIANGLSSGEMGRRKVLKALARIGVRPEEKL